MKRPNTMDEHDKGIKVHYGSKLGASRWGVYQGDMVVTHEGGVGKATNCLVQQKVLVLRS